MSSKTLQYVNIHTHHPDSEENSYRIVNYIVGHDEAIPQEYTISAGIHPWYINQIEHQVATLQKLTQQTHIVAIGECGLDKVCDTPWNLQIEAFKIQIEIANTFKKPLIIHCVKAYNEVISLLQDLNNNVPVIFHGFNKSKELAQSIVQKGYYLSLGGALEYPKMQEIIKTIPLNQLFFETDHSEIKIKEVYKLAEKALNLPLENIKSQVWQNLNNIIDT